MNYMLQYLRWSEHVTCRFTPYVGQAVANLLLAIALNAVPHVCAPDRHRHRHLVMRSHTTGVYGMHQWLVFLVHLASTGRYTASSQDKSQDINLWESTILLLSYLPLEIMSNTSNPCAPLSCDGL